MAKSEFGRSVLFVEGDDRQLRATLERDEALTRKAATSMQANLKPLIVGQQAVGQSAGAASAAVGVLGATAAATGSAALASAAQIGGMGAALGGMANAAVAGSKGILAMTKASLAFIATPLGIVLLAVAAAAAAVGNVFLKNKREQDAANATLAEMEVKLKASNKALKDEAKLLRQRIAIAGGADPLDFSGRNTALKLALREAEAAKKTREQEVARVASTAQRVEALGRELQILQGERTAADFIVNAEERRLTLLKERVTAGQRLVEQEKAKQRAIQATFAGRVGPQTLGGARDLVAGELKVLEAQKKRNALLERELALRLSVGRITQKQFDTLTKQFGLEQAQLGGGAVQLQTFKRVSLSQTALGGPGAQKVQPVKDKDAIRELKAIKREVRKPTVATAAP